jgi:hypothetical protein
MTDNEKLELIGDYGEAWGMFHARPDGTEPAVEAELALALFRATFELLTPVLGREPTEDEVIRCTPEEVGFFLRKYPD